VTEIMDRDSFIKICDRMMADDDAEALGAAREIRTNLIAAGLTWDDVLAPQDVAEEELVEAGEELVEKEADDNLDDANEILDEVEEDNDEDEEVEEVDKESVGSEGDSGVNAEALATIKRLLKRSDISASLREELEDYKIDIQDGEFDAGDRKYIKALTARLKSKK
jgi:hypothetical protein